MQSIQKKMFRVSVLVALCAVIALSSCSDNPAAPDQNPVSDRLLLKTEFSWFGVVLSWNRLDRAVCSGYLVQRSYALDDGFGTIDTLDAFECAYVDRNLVANETYSYRLVALDDCSQQSQCSNVGTVVITGSSLSLSHAARIIASGGGETVAPVNVLNGTVNALFDWTASENVDWFSLTATSGSTPNGFAMDADPNMTGSDRSGYVVVSAANIANSPDSLLVVQPVEGGILCPDPSELSVPPLAGTNSELTVLSCSGVPNCDWVAESDADWLTVLSDSGVSPAGISLAVDVNYSGAARVGNVSIAAAGHLEPPDIITVTQPVPFQPPVSYSPVGTPSSICCADFDGDGHKDLAVASSDQAFISIFRNNGDGTFGAAESYATSGETKWIRAGDLNNDGYIDLASVLSSGTMVSIHVNDGGGTFTVTGMTLNENLTRIFVADCDNDGDRDLVSTNRVLGDALVMVNDGSAAFPQLVRKKLGASPADVCAININNAGNLDLLSANSATDSVSMLISSGLLTYSAAVKFKVQDEPVSICSGDFNNDNRVDAAVACKGSDNVCVLRNTGASGLLRFASAGILPVVDEPNSICASDLDGDGDVDLTVAGWGASILVNRGSAVFASRLDIGSASEYLVDACAADFDGDGDLDLAFANQTAGTVTIYINNTH